MIPPSNEELTRTMRVKIKEQLVLLSQEEDSSGNSFTVKDAMYIARTIESLAKAIEALKR
jgi:hypothetical protein